MRGGKDSPGLFWVFLLKPKSGNVWKEGHLSIAPHWSDGKGLRCCNFVGGPRRSLADRITSSGHHPEGYSGAWVSSNVPREGPATKGGEK